MTGKLVKAQFEFENGAPLTVQYNPEKLQLDRTASWTEAKQQGKLSGLEFQKVSPAKLTMLLKFDTSIKGDDVRELFVNRLIDAMLPKIKYMKESTDQTTGSSSSGSSGSAPTATDNTSSGSGAPIEKQRPPKVTFRWGNLSFLGVIIDVKASYIMFNELGHPVRAEVNIIMQEFVPPKKMKIGTGSEAGYNIPSIKLVQMQQGQTLSMLAGAVGTTAQVLADMNGISDPLSVVAGTMLMVPGS